MDKVTIGILFGGASEEHSVSVTSAREIQRHLDLDRYEPVWVGISRSGRWQLLDDASSDVDGDDGTPAVLSPDRGVHGLVLTEDGRSTTVRLDVVLPVLHGTDGEDGAVQGLLELSGVPYVGCDIQSSALCMDKSLTYLVAQHAGVRVPRFWILLEGDDVDPDRFTYPLFAKPARSGSSFGVTKVLGPHDLAAAVEAARAYDSKVLVEEAVAGSEVGCAVLGRGTEVVTGEIDRIGLSHGFFRIHQEDDPEHGSENSTITVPADISQESRALVLDTARTLYRALGCDGLARIDLFLTDDGDIVLNEVNTFPGMTTYSRYPRMMDAAGLPLSDVLDRLVSLALTAGRP